MKNDYKLIEFPKICEYDGCLSFIEKGTHIPFSIARIFYIYGVKNNIRGQHAHKKCEQFIFPLIGSFQLSLHNGKYWYTYDMNSTEHNGVHVGTHIWVQLGNFSQYSVCMVLASKKYNKNDYINDFSKFKRITNAS